MVCIFVQRQGISQSEHFDVNYIAFSTTGWENGLTDVKKNKIKNHMWAIEV